MALTFEIGDPSQPRGHALLYFGAPSTGLLATYLVILPVKMDVSKYLPPMLAAQLGTLAGEMLAEGGGYFAAPPIPEAVETIEPLRRLAEVRGDDLIWGGDVVLGDMQAAMRQTAEALGEYESLYRARIDAVPVAASAPPQVEGPADAGGNVQHVLYELMNDRDRLAELSKLVGTMRFALESQDAALAAETDASLDALARALPNHYWGERVRKAAGDASGEGARLAQLYVERCYKLLDEEFAEVAALERAIEAVPQDPGDASPPSGDLRG